MIDQHWFAQEDLRIRLLTEEAGSFQGVVVEAEERAEGPVLVADFPRATAPSLPIGTEVPLLFWGPSLVSDLTGSGMIVLRSEDFFRQRYAFQISNETVFPLAQAIQQRRAVRVQPTGKDPISVELSTMDGKFRCQPNPFDLSISGISMRVPMSDEKNFYDAWDVKVTLQMSTSPEPFTMAGTVRGRRRVGSSLVLYGVEFDPKKTPDFDQKQAAIQKYVTEVQGDNFRRIQGSDVGSSEAPATPKKNKPGPANAKRGASAKASAKRPSPRRKSG